MSVGAAIYGYRSNFGCKVGNKITKKKKISVKLIDLMRDGYRTISLYDDDLFVSICQWLMRKGYPCGLSISDNTDNIDTFLRDALFSICPFHSQNLMINKQGFELFKWRKQFNIFREMEIEGLNFYRNRFSMPIENFKSFNDVKRRLFTNYGDYNEIVDKLNFRFNSSWDDAIWILKKYIYISNDTFSYNISYGCKDDFEDAKNHKAHSSWDIRIESEKNENYIDFCLRIFHNYDKILSGDKNVLISENEDRHFYLGGNFKLK